MYFFKDCLYCLYCLFCPICLFTAELSLSSYCLWLPISQKRQKIWIEKPFTFWGVFAALPRLYNGGVYPPPGGYKTAHFLLLYQFEKINRKSTQYKIAPQHSKQHHTALHRTTNFYEIWENPLYIKVLFNISHYHTARNLSLQKILLIIWKILDKRTNVR